MAGESVRQAFTEQGYLIIPDVVPAELCERVVDAIHDFTGIDPDDPATWHPEKFAGLGIVPLHHHQALWNVRQHPAVYEVFRELYQDTRLWVSMDRAGYKPPASEATRDWQRPAVHWDCDPWHYDGYGDGFGAQGLVYLTDTSAEQGAFSCVPSIYRHLDAWLRDHERDDKARYPDIGEEPLVAVPGGAGSLVVFHRLMPHTNGLNLTNKPRLAQYVTMEPAGSESARIERVGQWRDKMPPAWAVRQKLVDQLIPEPGEPAELTSLGRKLVGLDEWD